MAITQSDVIFWSKRISEHMYFIYILTNQERAGNFSTISYNLWQSWKKVVKRKGKPTLKIIKDTKAAKRSILKRSRKGKINEVLTKREFESLLRHMIKELNFFSLRLRGPVSNAKEISFWLEEASEHTNLASAFMHSNLEKLDALKLSKQLKEISKDPFQKDTITKYNKSNRGAKKLVKDLAKNKRCAKDHVRLLLVKHEIKESTKGAKRLKFLLKTKKLSRV